MIGQMASGIVQMQKWQFSGFGSGIWTSFFFKLSKTMSRKKDESNVSPGGKMMISTIPMGVKHRQNITFFASISCMDRVGRLMPALTHTADLGFSNSSQVSSPVMIRARSLTWRWLSRRKSFREILTLSSF
jgi:hypothetical protein